MSLFLDHPDLLRGFRAGDAAVLERTYYEYVDLVSAVVGRHARFPDGSSSPDRVDLVQDVFIRAFQDRARLAYDGLRPYRPLLMTITRNLIVDWARKHGRERPQILDDEAVASEPEALDPLLMARVEAFVGSLEGPLRGVYEQRYVNDASQDDAARALGLSRQQIRTLEKRLREDLARAIEK